MTAGYLAVIPGRPSNAAGHATLQDEVQPAFERFSAGARDVLVSAQKEAVQAHHNYIGTEHILLGLLLVDGETQRLLQRLGVDEAGVRATIRSVLGRSQPVPVQQIVPTTRVKKVIELAFGAAQRERATEVTPRHLLIGLMEEGDGIGAHVLQDLGVTLEAVTGGHGSG